LGRSERNLFSHCGSAVQLSPLSLGHLTGIKLNGSGTLGTGTVFRGEDYLEKILVGTQEYPLKNQSGAEGNTAKIDLYFNEYVNPNSVTEPFVRVVNVDMVSDVDTKTPGVYSVTYTVDYDGVYTGYARLNVVVEE
jgi:hypothetical protein